jgi:Arc/MetJ family transcription regulator
MIERGAQLAAGLFERGEIDDEASARVGLAAQRNLHLERVAVDAAIRMAGRKMGEVVRGVEAEAVGELHHVTGYRSACASAG